MKKIMIYGFIAFGLLFSSCSSENANADVDKLIANLNYFNQTFDELNKDGIVSTEAEGNEISEYDQLRELANQYYDALNNINKKIDKERLKAEEGQKTKGYEKAFEAAKQEKQSEIEKATQTFMKNLEKIKPAEQLNAKDVVEEVIETVEEEVNEVIEDIEN